MIKKLIWLSLGMMVMSLLNAQTLQKETMIKGSNVAIQAPNEFVSSTDFLGFKHSSDPYAMIIYMNIPAPFSSIRVGFTPENLQAQNMELLDKKVYKNGKDSIYFLDITQVSNDLLYRKYILMWGNASESFMLNGMALDDSTQTLESIRKSLATLRIVENSKTDVEDVIEFALDTTGTNLKKAYIVGTNITYSRDGNLPPKSADKTTFFVGKSFSERNIQDVESFAVNRLRQLPGDYILDSDYATEEVVIDGIAGVCLYGVDKETKEDAIMQIILPKGAHYYIMLGMYDKEDRKAKEDLWNISQTFKLK